MPSALQQSRDLLARGVARVRSGLDAYGRNLDRPGPEITVAPFDAQNVTPETGLIKLGTSIAAARRKRANYDAAREGLELEREKTRAEIARLRAQESYYLGTGRQTGSQRRVSSQPIGDIPAGTPMDEVAAIQRQRNMENIDVARKERTARAGKVTAATAGMKRVDEAVNRMVESAVTRRMASYEATVFPRALKGDPRALAAVGISQEEWDYLTDYPQQQVELLNKAKDELRKKAVERAKIEAERHPTVGGRRRRFQSIIEQGAQGQFDDLDAEAAAAGGGGTTDFDAMIRALEDVLPQGQPGPPE